MDKKIIVVGSLNTEKEVQDRVRVLHRGGVVQALRATDHKDPPKVLRERRNSKNAGNNTRGNR